MISKPNMHRHIFGLLIILTDVFHMLAQAVLCVSVRSIEEEKHNPWTPVENLPSGVEWAGEQGSDGEEDTHDRNPGSGGNVDAGEENYESADGGGGESEQSKEASQGGPSEQRSRKRDRSSSPEQRGKQKHRAPWADEDAADSKSSKHAAAAGIRARRLGQPPGKLGSAAAFNLDCIRANLGYGSTGLVFYAGSVHLSVHCNETNSCQVSTVAFCRKSQDLTAFVFTLQSASSILALGRTPHISLKCLAAGCRRDRRRQ